MSHSRPHNFEEDYQAQIGRAESVTSEEHRGHKRGRERLLSASPPKEPHGVKETPSTSKHASKVSRQRPASVAPPSSSSDGEKQKKKKRKPPPPQQKQGWRRPKGWSMKALQAWQKEPSARQTSGTKSSAQPSASSVKPTTTTFQTSHGGNNPALSAAFASQQSMGQFNPSSHHSQTYSRGDPIQQLALKSQTPAHHNSQTSQLQPARFSKNKILQLALASQGVKAGKSRSTNSGNSHTVPTPGASLQQPWGQNPTTQQFSAQGFGSVGRTMHSSSSYGFNLDNAALPPAGPHQSGSSHSTDGWTQSQPPFDHNSMPFLPPLDPNSSTTSSSSKQPNAKVRATGGKHESYDGSDPLLKIAFKSQGGNHPYKPGQLLLYPKKDSSNQDNEEDPGQDYTKKDNPRRRSRSKTPDASGRRKK